jgi:hypothetical protein
MSSNEGAHRIMLQLLEGVECGESGKLVIFDVLMLLPSQFSPRPAPATSNRLWALSSALELDATSAVILPWGAAL